MPTSDPRVLSPLRRRLLTAGAAVLIPVLFFLLLEGGLRLFGYGNTYPLFIPVEIAPDYLYQNPDVARRYFTRQASIPNSPNDFFKAEKDSGTFRIVVQGGSSAAGFPYYYGGSFARMLEQRLLQTFPGRNIEVVNTAMAAVNTYTLLDLVDEILVQDPDLVLVYAGHNEYYGTLGVGSTESLGPVRPLVLLYLKLRRFRTVQALQAMLTGAAGWFDGATPGAEPGATLMSRMVGEQAIPYGSPLYELGVRQFRANLDALLARYAEAGVPVFIGTLASNERDHRPFVSLPATDAAAWEARYQAGVQAAAEGDTARALTVLDEVVAMDSIAALGYYTRGRLHDAAGRYERARADYVAARDRDQLRFRAPEAMNAVIREVAAQHGAVVVETQAALRAASPGGIIGANAMLEHLHPNTDGYFLIADAFYEALRTAGAIGPWTQPVPAAVARREVLLTPVDSLVARFRVMQLMQSWPFQPAGTRSAGLSYTPKSPVEEIAMALYERDVSWYEAANSLRAYYEEQGDYTAALRVALAVIQEYPFAPEPYLAAGNILVKHQRYDDAVEYFLASNDRRPSSEAMRMVGSIRLHQGRRDEAIDWLEQALERDPRDLQALYNLGGAYALTGQHDRARATVQRLLDLDPDHAEARRLLDGLPEPGS